MTDYCELCRQLQALTEDVPYETANLANAAALLYMTLPRINWAGFYKRQGECLILGPFQGKPACIQIPWGRGVCGTAAAENRTQRVQDVHRFPGHIPCDSASRSELVIPIRLKAEVWGVLDIDSPEKARFSPEDQKGLEEFCGILEKVLERGENW